MVEFADFNHGPKETPMTDASLPLIELLQKQDDGDFLRSLAEAVQLLLMEHDVEGVIGAGRYERGDGRQTWRNGYRDREFKTRLGALNLRVPKLRQGSYFPGFLEPRWTSEKALVAFAMGLEPWRHHGSLQEAWIGGVSTRRVDDLVQAMGLTGISKSTVSKLCRDIDERVKDFLDRPLTGLIRMNSVPQTEFPTVQWTVGAVNGPTFGSMRPTSRCVRVERSSPSPQ